MTARRALKDAAVDPSAKKEGQKAAPRSDRPGAGHVVLMVAVGFAAGVIGGLLSARWLRML